MVKINFSFELKSLAYYYLSINNYIENKVKKVVSWIRQSDKISELEKKLKIAEREAKDSFNLSVEEERKRKKAEYDKLLLESKLDKIFKGNSHLKKILDSSNRTIEALSECILPKRKNQAKVRISKEHPRHQRYKDFIKTIANLDFVAEVIDKEAKQAKYSKVKIRGDEILVTYLDDHTHRKSYHAVIKTTAKNEGQLYVAACIIESYLPKLNSRNNKS